MTDLMVRPNGIRQSRANITVGISEVQLSRNAADVVVVPSISSGVVLTLYDPVARVGGVMHCMLPHSKVDPGSARLQPYLFVDSGVVAMLEAVSGMGAQRGNIQAKVAGAGSPLGQEETFCLGQRNLDMMHNMLQGHGIPITAADTGATRVRAVYFYMADGRTTVVSEGREVEL